MMTWPIVLPFGLIALLFACVAQASIVEHTFNVGNLSISQLCQPPRIITAVNGQLPGPAIHAREGDTVVVHLVNQSPYNMTIHWHGIFQRGTPWADGATMVTQCPVQPGGNQTENSVGIHDRGAYLNGQHSLEICADPTAAWSFVFVY